MAHQVETIKFALSTIGTERSIKVHRIGKIGARPKVYLQAGLHANEIPGLLILHHLLAALLDADKIEDVLGEIVVVPYANPIGLGGYVLGSHVGRVALENGMNFNRGFPDLAALVAQRISGRLDADGKANVAVIRAAMAEALSEIVPRTEFEEMRLALLKQAADTDFVIDLHSEQNAKFAIILGPWCQAGMRDFAADLQPDELFIADAPALFDTILSRPWHDLALRFSAHPIPQACLSGCFEMRGVASVSDAMAKNDADRYFNALRRLGVIAGDPGPAPELHAEPISFKGVEFLRAPRAGVVVYKHELGTHVDAGQVVAEIVDPAAEDPRKGRTPVRSTEAGIFFARCHNVLVAADETIAKVAGRKPLSDPKHY